MSVSVLLHSEYGVPEHVIQTSSYVLPKVGPDHVLVSVLFSPINPADLNMMEGKYYTQPPLPSVLGNEGVGVVEAVGDGVFSVKKGDRVIMPFRDKENWIGWWTESFIAHEKDLIVVPDSISDQQAAMLTVNPVTAYQLLTRFTDLEKGDFVAFNAANSGVGRWIAAFADDLGFKTIALVRTEESRARVTGWGADHVLLDEPGVSKKIREISTVRLALNAVGGTSARELSKSLDSDAMMVTYGAMSKEPIQVGNMLFIYQTAWLTGFNRSKWVQEAHPEEVRIAYGEVFKLIERKSVEVDIEEVYPSERVVDAIRHAQRPMRSGKVLLSF